MTKAPTLPKALINRYILAIQYHGTPYHGFSKQPSFRTVEGDLTEALDRLVGNGNHHNMQVSSRTDRGVHALFNTLHVDIACRDNENRMLNPNEIKRGLNYYLARGGIKSSAGKWQQYDPRNINVRVLHADRAPLHRAYSKHNYDVHPRHVQHTAICRMYVYRMLITDVHDGDYWFPFERDRAWHVRCNDAHYRRNAIHVHGDEGDRIRSKLDVKAMRDAAHILTGTHDFTSFRNRGCVRSTPITTLYGIHIDRMDYAQSSGWDVDNLLRNSNSSNDETTTTCIGDDDSSLLWRHNQQLWHKPSQAELIRILFTGKSFNIVRCAIW